GEPLDISRSALRAVSPIHIEYLENMEVGASLSAAIIVKGKLWGLIACHHRTAKYLDFYQRESCRFLAQMFSTELTLRETSETLSRSELSDNIRRQLVKQMSYHKD
ncbi:GAF domain-containing protein, partial [Salinimicrobium oceani]